MPTFGYAAFLKLVSLNPKPQKTELRNRLVGGTGSAYDFHRSLKLAARRHLVDETPLDELLEAAASVKQPYERNSLVEGLKALAIWREGAGGQVINLAPKIYESPRRLFKVAAQPEFGLAVGASRVAFHLWNTKTVDLKPEALYAALGLLPDLYAEDEPPLSDFGVLSLREPKVYLLSGRPARGLSTERLVFGIEELILQIRDELGGPPATPPQPNPRGTG